MDKRFIIPEKAKEPKELSVDDIDDISRSLTATKRESEERVARAHRDGNQIIYGGYRRYDAG